MQYVILFLMTIGIVYRGTAQKVVIQNPEFHTVNQQMWAPASSPSPGLNKKFVIFPEYSFHQPFSTESFTLLSFAGLDFGAVMDGHIAFGVGPFEFEISEFTDGRVDVNYPANVTLIMPDDNTFNPGETIVIKSSFEAAPGAELLTHYPETGKIGLYMGVMFDASFGLKLCFVDCLPRISLLPPPGISLPTPMFDQRFKFFEVRADGLTYICDNTANPIDFALHPFECDISSGGPPWSIAPGAGAFIGTMDIPYVETTSSMANARDIQAEGADPYLTASINIVELLGYIPPLKVVTEVLDNEQTLGGIPDVTGTERGITVSWSLVSISLNLPISQSQNFNFEPRVYTALQFPDTVDYVIHSIREGDKKGRGVSFEYEVDDSVSVRFPCNYDYMDVYATHRIGSNTFRNKTFDNISLNLDFAAIDFGLVIDEYIIIPEICIPIPFTNDFCIGPIGSPRVEIDPPPLIDPPPVTLVSQDFPPYFEDEWELSGFNTFPVATPFRLKPRERDVNFAVQHVTCYGDSTGTIVTTVPGGSTPLQYEWSFGSTAANPVNVPAGSHYLKLTDANRCESVEPVQIVQPPAIDVVVDHTDILCNGGTSVITSSASGGTGALSFAWSSGESTAVLSGKTAGKYILTVDDAAGCIMTDSVTLAEPTPLVGKIATAIDPSCANADDGSLTLFVEGGTAPYNFQWSNGSSQRDQQLLEGGAYTITVTDANNCTTSDSRTLIEPSLLNVSLTKLADVSCYGGNDGGLRVTASGGTVPYTYRWYDSLVTLNNVTSMVNGLQRGSYSVEVTDDRACKTVRNLTIYEPLRPLQADILPIPGPCNNESSGSLDLTVQGGTPPYEYAWSTGESVEDLTNVPAGRYEITVTDSEGCQNRNKTLLADPDPIRAQVIADDVSCADQRDGRVYVASVRGGVAPYQMIWSTGTIGDRVEGLAEGTYAVTITDATGCRLSESRTISTQDVGCLFIPNAFSPNGDDTNDTWNIRNIHLYPKAEIKVFNKWGNTVFESSAYSTPWDGTYKGKIVEAATYYYAINLHNGDPVYQGFLVIIK
jgi:gliding motility-associated-like protein